METLFALALLFSFILIFHKFISQNKVQHKNLPPSPITLPIIGHFHLLRKPLHHALHNLSNRYGPILFLRFGQRPVLVVSTPSAIEECFTKNDIIFSNRPLFPSRKRLEYNFTSLGIAPYGDHWRNLRRLTALEVFSPARLQMSSKVRTEEIRFLAKQLCRCSAEGVRKVVNTRSFFYLLTFNIVMRLVAGNRYFDGDDWDSDESRRRLDDLKLIFSPTLDTPLGDFFPFLRWLTYYGAEKKMERKFRQRDEFLQGLIDRNRNSKSSTTDGEGQRTLIDVMLSLQESEPEYYTDEIIKGIILVMLIAGTHTSALTMETAVSRLISHPDVLKKARDEIDANVKPSQLLDDADLSKLSYLHCIINETHRSGPLGTIIPPRESSAECTFGGFNIPRGTMLLVNEWALHRDPKVWVDPQMFKPERFEGNEGDDKLGFKFIPFGFGRRKCPGAGLATRLMALSLGTLIQCFEWEEVGEDCGDVGLENGLNTVKEKPMEVIFRPRKTMIDALSLNCEVLLTF